MEDKLAFEHFLIFSRCFYEHCRDQARSVYISGKMDMHLYIKSVCPQNVC